MIIMDSGAFLMAGAEMIKAKDKLVDLSKRRCMYMLNLE